MGLPKTLKDMMVFNEGQNYMGQVGTVSLPTLTRTLESWRGAGMDIAAKVDVGGAELEMEFTFGGPMRDILRQYGAVGLGAVYMRFAGAYQADDTGDMAAVEVIVRGRHEEIELGEASLGELSEFKTKFVPSYFKLLWNGTTEIEIDIPAGTFIVGGVDRRAAIRAAIGM